jgi:hypothetical protein
MAATTSLHRHFNYFARDWNQIEAVRLASFRLRQAASSVVQIANHSCVAMTASPLSRRLGVVGISLRKPCRERQIFFSIFE